MHRCVMALDLALGAVSRVSVERWLGVVRFGGGRLVVRSSAESFEDSSGGASADVGESDEDGYGRQGAVALTMPLRGGPGSVRGSRCRAGGRAGTRLGHPGRRCRAVHPTDVQS